MPTRYSPGVILAWQIAAVEARGGSHEFIEREHLFIGLAKVESWVNEADDALLESHIGDAHALKEEVLRLGDCFRAQTVDVETARRRARYLAGTGSAGESRSETIHRSSQCREVFHRAEECAAQSSATVHSLHLLAGLLAQPGVPVAQAVVAGGGDVERLREAATKAMAEYAPEAARESRAAPPGVLATYGTDLTELARQGKIEPLVGRRKELLQLVRAICRKTKNNPLLLGEPGVGKTALVRALAQRISEGSVPAELSETRIIEVNLGALVAGTKYRGEFEQRLAGLLREVKARPEVMLFLDEIHTIVGAGAAAGSLDAANILKPALSSGEIRCIGSTTVAEYRKYFEHDAALSRRFLPILVKEATPEEALEVLEELREQYERHHGVWIEPPALRAAVELSCRYLADRKLPDKALDLLDDACVRMKVGSAALRPGAAELELLDEVISPTVTADTVALVVAEQTGIPMARLSPGGREMLQGMREALERRVVGQAEAIEKVTRTVTMARAGLGDPNRPMGVLLFVGPTGVGKTELCRALAEFLSGSEQEMIRIDMSEYKERHSVSRLIGAPPGYVGHGEEGQLTGRLRTRPHSVVLFDEIEKAHPEVCDLFLQLFDAGRLTDAQGRTVDGRNAIFIMTSNVVASGRKAVGFLAPEEGEASKERRMAEDDREEMREELSRHFRPEFLNRIDEVVRFRPLASKDIRRIAAAQLARVAQSLRAQAIAVTFSEEAVDWLVRQGYDEENGARELTRTIDRLVRGPLSGMLVEESVHPGETLLGRVDGDRIRFDLVEIDPDRARRQQKGER